MCRLAVVLFAPLAILPAGCFVSPEQPARTETVYVIGYAEFIEAWRHRPQHAAHEWTGQRITMAFPARGYSILPDAIAIYSGAPGAGPTLLFEVADPPKDTSRAIIVSGLCQGVIETRRSSGPRREGFDWHIRVVGCEWRAQTVEVGLGAQAR